MILGKHRFHGYNSLRYVYSHGTTFRGTMLAVRIAENSRRDSYRCAVVVSKKISKSAVVRNRIRRRMYELMRAEGVHIERPVDIVITIYSDQVATVPASELKTTFNKLLAQAGVLK